MSLKKLSDDELKVKLKEFEKLIKTEGLNPNIGTKSFDNFEVRILFFLVFKIKLFF